LQEPVHCDDKSDIVCRQTYGREHNNHGDQSSLRNACSPNAGSCSCD
ncbi:hypothetical protein N309_14546, partial [Tinamus guttatus]